MNGIMNGARTAVTLMPFIAPTAWLGVARSRPLMMNDENAYIAPPMIALPSAARIVSR
jgi:hypothetical protein